MIISTFIIDSCRYSLFKKGANVKNAACLSVLGTSYIKKTVIDIEFSYKEYDTTSNKFLIAVTIKTCISSLINKTVLHLG